ncbi:MAG: wyosine biosynthesis protein TYW1 [Candidatus Syntrophoarchaeum caldarius]|uniref:S-adenosyl-L-methionine-dependent tRNA 4-demethylwyosine synthase n=1 Tax=Candidatus Syntropharchaeum caldarium TaxID=1838285 RepID=A0A1F2P817_9EURY|nr:MAG: wyosine biosynthesis protein TYW1 [Candidatus Syntrophoarchaeum caldarius]
MLESQGYHLFGEHKHSATKRCLWLRRALRGGELCYKGKFYGIASHRCIQMTPSIHCNHECIHCWRPFIDKNEEIIWDMPSELIKGVLTEHRRLLSGYGGSDKTDHKRLLEAEVPKHVAISLIGEPTMYPYLPQLIDEFNKMGLTTFLVTNGTNPDVLKAVRPTQCYISLNAPNKVLYEHVCQPEGDYWENIMKSLEIMAKANWRRTIRLTLIKGINMIDPEAYAELIRLAKPDFVEVKSYMHLGHSRMRLDRGNMPAHHEIKEFADDLLEFMDEYCIRNEVEISRVVMIGKKESSYNCILEV